jgi:hypothetical protein
MNNPYSKLDDFQHHYRALRNHNVLDLNLTSNYEPLVTKETKIATLGSCFAQHVSSYLDVNGYSVMRLEPESASEFAANYGNIYTARQARQLLAESLGMKKPKNIGWIDQDGKWRDSIRVNAPGIQFQTEDELLEARQKHLAQVRRVFTESDVIVFTLGLTEAWVNITDETVYLVAPGVIAGKYDPDVFTFKNFNVKEVVEDLIVFARQISDINPNAKIILTVSPVPLVATYEKRHVIISSIYSKSVLRVAVEEALEHVTNLRYFHSYELITNQTTQSRFFENDFRGIKKSGVQYVMRNFVKTFISSQNSGSQKTHSETSNHKLIDRIICDEDLLK